MPVKSFASAFAALSLTGAVAVAADIDLSTMTCRKFQTAAKDDVTVILAWLDGFYKQEDDPPVIDTSHFAANAKKLNDYCAAHPDLGLISATDKLFQRE